MEDKPEISGSFGSKDSGNKLSFSGAGGSNGLKLGAVCNGGMRQEEGKTGCGATIAEVIRMGGINVSSELVRFIGGGKSR